VVIPPQSLVTRHGVFIEPAGGSETAHPAKRGAEGACHHRCLRVIDAKAFTPLPVKTVGEIVTAAGISSG
jgi:hypothetical protein